MKRKMMKRQASISFHAFFSHLRLWNCVLDDLHEQFMIVNWIWTHCSPSHHTELIINLNTLHIDINLAFNFLLSILDSFFSSLNRFALKSHLHARHSLSHLVRTRSAAWHGMYVHYNRWFTRKWILNRISKKISN